MALHSVQYRSLVAMLWLLAASVMAQSSAEAVVDTAKVWRSSCPPNLGRPCVGLVLGGGGARGSAHIGVLKALEEYHIPVDVIVGTSIGSLVGGLYATGKTADEIEQLFRETNWTDGYRDRTDRSKTPNRRKRQLDSIPIHLDLGFDGQSIKLPQGFVQGQGMKALVERLLGNYPRFNSFDELSIPFRAVAADAETGEQVILDAGDLADALQTSMSIPGVVRPIELDGRLLVDGGIANNLPVSVAKAIGADLIIAVDIGSPTKQKDELDSGLAILLQITAFLTRANVEQQKSLLGEDDVYLQPDIQDVSILSFERTLEALEPGYLEAQRVFSQSKALANLVEMAEDHIRKPEVLLSEAVFQVDAIELNNNSRLGDDYILDRMQLQPNSTYSQEDIQLGMERLHGQGTIARTNTSLTDDGLSTLNIDVGEKEWGPGYLDFKLALEDDFSSFSRYQLGGSFRLTNLSPYGAEWYSVAEFGTDKLFFSELYWPLSTTGFFITTAGAVNRSVQGYTLEGVSLGETINSSAGASGGIGWSTTDKFDLRLSAVYQEGELKLPDLLVELAMIDELEYNQFGLVLDANYDTLDHATFPSKGAKLSAEIRRTKDELEKIIDYTTQVDVELNLVGSLGNNTLRALLRYQSTVNDDPLSLLGAFQLGGFLNLSGLSPVSLSGQHVRFSSLVYTYEMAANDFGAIQLPLYLGASLEAGNVWAQKSDIDYDELIYSGSVFIGWDSPIGPAYLAYGHSDAGDESLYVFLGVVF
ncbi:patatin-like phospholipase family protein [Oceanicoccus sp. KOV_DT_Chl]|uniref:patatin-like phospholipase family protein n=1 Tax=Oceanicoccus sp. KOV_DT_Chl TaxID=1904639 RepID=UPI000C7D6E61|nr:patatin-like phospholipase family protein [Oceanicoccus sp. KOV_DT_Chl]